MNVIRERRSQGLLDFVSSDFRPGRVQKSPEAGLVHLKNDLLDILDYRSIAEFAGAQGFRGALSLDAKSDAVGDRAHLLKDGFGQGLACEHGHDTHEFFLENQGIRCESMDLFFARPISIHQRVSGLEMVEQKWFALRHPLELE